MALYLAGCGSAQDPSSAKAAGKKGAGDVPVTIAKAIRKEVPIDLDVIGHVDAYSTVTITPQVSGELVKVLFKEGDFVTVGQPLFEIDRRMLEAQLAQAEANLTRSDALLHQAQANLQKDQAQLQFMKDEAKRYAELAKEGVFSAEQAQQQQSSADAQAELIAADKASIESSRADIQAQKAMIANLKVQLEFTTITSPIVGRTGTLLVKMGNIVTANNTQLVTINQIQPLFVTYPIPEVKLKSVASRFGKEKIEVFASSTEGGETHQGVLTFYENTVDPTTGTITLRATFPNADRKMWPGEFVRVRMRLGTLPDAVVLPNQAVQTGQDGAFVYIVKGDNTVESRPVTTSVRSGQELVIASGLEVGETVVLEGQLRLAPGMKVSIRQPGERKGAGGPAKKGP